MFNGVSATRLYPAFSNQSEREERAPARAARR
jgi:hypothetical protein